MPCSSPFLKLSAHSNGEMQTLSEFYEAWRPEMLRQAHEIADKVEAGQNMGRFLVLEPQGRDAVDNLVREYSESLRVAPSSLSSAEPGLGPPELGYLLHIRLWHALEFAQFLSHCGFEETRMSASDWIEFLAIDSWHEFTRHKWRFEFSKMYGEPPT